MCPHEIKCLELLSQNLNDTLFRSSFYSVHIKKSNQLIIMYNKMMELWYVCIFTHILYVPSLLMQFQYSFTVVVHKEIIHVNVIQLLKKRS